MKVRLYYVSNSSSSSWTCDVCGQTEAGYDCSASDVGMRVCVNEHVYCEDHAIDAGPMTIGELRKILGNHWNDVDFVERVHPGALLLARNLDNLSDDAVIERLPYYNQDVEDWIEDILEGNDRPAQCPICSFQEVPRWMGYDYLLKSLGKTHADIIAEMHNKFSSYDALMSYLHDR